MSIVVDYPIRFLIEFLYVLSLVGLSINGVQCWVMLSLYLRHRRDKVVVSPAPTEWPYVTVQLPIYNEQCTAERLLAAVAALDYPRDRLQIQVLDDSSDGTRGLMALAVRNLQRDGIDAVHVTRPNRAGFKAGALAAGMATAKGELVALFDADFVPQRDFLRRLVPHFADSTVGCVQARWEHLNRDYSFLTRMEALALDSHFIVEQLARSRSGLFLNFNGSAGVWRRAAIEQAGGWSADTLAEDLDLSYRAQLCGWRIVYLPDVVVHAELPVQISAFKKQQARWAQGATRTAIKLTGQILRSKQPWPVKVQAIMHLNGFVVHPMVVLFVLLSLPISFSRAPAMVVTIGPWLMITALGVPLYLVSSQMFGRGLGWQDGARRSALIPLWLVAGVGLSLNNSWAMLKALSGRQESFHRTPKPGLRSAGETWVNNVYALDMDWLVWVELGLAMLFLAATVMRGVRIGVDGALLPYMAGFGYVATLGLKQAYQRWRWGARQLEQVASGD